MYLLIFTKNLVARGEHQKPAGAAGAVAGGEDYDPANHNVLSNPMDPSVQGGNEFYGAPDY